MVRIARKIPKSRTAVVISHHLQRPWYNALEKNLNKLDWQVPGVDLFLTLMGDPETADLTKYVGTLAPIEPVDYTWMEGGYYGHMVHHELRKAVNSSYKEIIFLDDDAYFLK